MYERTLIKSEKVLFCEHNFQSQFSSPSYTYSSQLSESSVTISTSLLFHNILLLFLWMSLKLGNLPNVGRAQDRQDGDPLPKEQLNTISGIIYFYFF